MTSTAATRTQVAYAAGPSRPPWRLALMVSAGVSLLAGLDAALVLIGLPAPVRTERLPEVHGMLLVLGFVGTLVALERAVALRRTADEHDDAAQALRHHADEVDRLKDLIREIANRVRGLIEGAKSRLASLADKAIDLVKKITPDPIDEMLSSFQPPPEGHKDWLDVPDQLPGGGR